MSKIEIETRGWLISILQSLLSAGPILLSFGLAEAKSPGSIPTYFWYLFPIVFGIISFSISIVRENRTKRAEDNARVSLAVEKANFSKIIRIPLRHIIDKHEDRRANIMLIETHGKIQVLKIRHRHGNDKTPSDNDLAWEKHEGCCGRAWASNRQVKVDLTKVNPEIMTTEWGMNPQQIACTAQLKCVVSTPIRNKEDGSVVIGVLNCDSTLSLEDSGLNTPEFSNRFEQHAEIVSNLISFLKEIEEK